MPKLQLSDQQILDIVRMLKNPDSQENEINAYNQRWKKIQAVFREVNGNQNQENDDFSMIDGTYLIVRLLNYHCMYPSGFSSELFLNIVSNLLDVLFINFDRTIGFKNNNSKDKKRTLRGFVWIPPVNSKFFNRICIILSKKIEELDNKCILDELEKSSSREFSERERTPYVFFQKDLCSERKQFSEIEINTIIGILRICALNKDNLELRKSLVVEYIIENVTRDFGTHDATSLLTKLLTEILIVLESDLERTGDDEEQGPYYESILIYFMQNFPFNVEAKFDGNDDATYCVEREMPFINFFEHIQFTMAEAILFGLMYEHSNSSSTGKYPKYPEPKRGENNAESKNQNDKDKAKNKQKEENGKPDNDSKPNEKMTSKKAYEILGTLKSKDLKGLRQAYYAKAFSAHPDKGGTDEAFQELQNAYEHLVKRYRQRQEKAQGNYRRHRR